MVRYCPWVTSQKNCYHDSLLGSIICACKIFWPYCNLPVTAVTQGQYAVYDTLCPAVYDCDCKCKEAGKRLQRGRSLVEHKGFSYVQPNGQTDGRMNGWSDGHTDGWINEWMDKEMVGWIALHLFKRNSYPFGAAAQKWTHCDKTSCIDTKTRHDVKEPKKLKIDVKWQMSNVKWSSHELQYFAPLGTYLREDRPQTKPTTENQISFSFWWRI